MFAMSLAVEVSLISGKTVSLEAASDESVESLRLRAQSALGVGKGRLLNSTGDVLHGEALIKRATGPWSTIYFNAFWGTSYLKGTLMK